MILNGCLTLKTVILYSSSRENYQNVIHKKKKIRNFFVKFSFCQSPYLRLSSKPSSKMIFLTPINEYHSII